MSEEVMTGVRTATRMSVLLLVIGGLLWLMGVVSFPNNGLQDDDDGRRRYELKVRQRPINGVVNISYMIDGGATDHATMRGDTWHRQVWARGVVLIASQNSSISILECWIIDPFSGRQLDHDVLHRQTGEVDCFKGA